MFMNVRGPMKQKTIANRRYPRDKDINELFLFFPIDLFCESLSSALKRVESKLCNYTFQRKYKIKKEISYLHSTVLWLLPG